MSLFKAREYWSVSPSECDEYDHRCLAVANIDNNPNGDGLSFFFFPYFFLSWEFTFLGRLLEYNTYFESSFFSLKLFSCSCF
jgi:hypothetical protein